MKFVAIFEHEILFLEFRVLIVRKVRFKRKKAKVQSHF